MALEAKKKNTTDKQTESRYQETLEVLEWILKEHLTQEENNSIKIGL